MNIKFFFFFGLLFGVANSKSVVKTKTVKLVFTTSVTSIRLPECKKKDWEVGLGEYVDRTRIAVDHFPGSAFELGDAVLASFKVYVEKLTALSTSDSPIFSFNSMAVLRAMSKLNKLGESPTVVIQEMKAALPGMVKDYQEIVSSLSGIIGKLTEPINKAMSDLESSFGHYMTAFLKNCGDAGKIAGKKIIDFKPVDKDILRLINTIAFTSKTTLNHCKLSEVQAIYEAIASIQLFMIHVLVCVAGVSICSQAIFIDSSKVIPVALKAATTSIEPLLRGITDSVVAIKTSSAESVKKVTVNFVKDTTSFNATLKELLGLCDHVDLTAREVVTILSDVHDRSQT